MQNIELQLEHNENWIENKAYRQWHYNPLFDDDVLLTASLSALTSVSFLPDIYEQVLIDAEASFKWFDLLPLKQTFARKPELIPPQFLIDCCKISYSTNFL
jgi:hypothetical protein